MCIVQELTFQRERQISIPQFFPINWKAWKLLSHDNHSFHLSIVMTSLKRATFESLDSAPLNVLFYKKVFLVCNDFGSLS
jgi:hypothetical protein